MSDPKRNYGWYVYDKEYATFDEAIRAFLKPLYEEERQQILEASRLTPDTFIKVKK